MLVLVAVAATTSNFRFANDKGVVVFFFWHAKHKQQNQKNQHLDSVWPDHQIVIVDQIG